MCGPLSDQGSKSRTLAYDRSDGSRRAKEILRSCIAPEAGIIGKPVVTTERFSWAVWMFLQRPKANSPKLPKRMLSRFRSFQKPLRDHLPKVVVTAVRKLTANLFQYDL
ncbi:hypothetical protein IVB41_02090 [Bradyrhizobium sp. 44]|uniref:hypothetical protein n=1 Tax=Bradyrhizobium sp. 44 TaxID=2782675 RepID=UPI001FFA8344|nr:hypothetical protein [Bradyrhizobium sp. 44]MCK1282725.1 hypothetical protein [Bradyrhizobium sp. 44]